LEKHVYTSSNCKAISKRSIQSDRFKITRGDL
jgi:hypothetical protein